MNSAGREPAEGAGGWESSFLDAFGLDASSCMFFCSSQLPLCLSVSLEFVLESNEGRLSGDEVTGVTNTGIGKSKLL